MNNAKIVLDRREDINGQPMVMIYGIIVGDTFNIPLEGPLGGLRRLVMGDVTITIDSKKRYVEPANAQLGSPEDILENKLHTMYWNQESQS